MLQAFYMGTESRMDAFTIAFLIPNLLRRLTAEGAMTAAFIPVFTKLKSEKKREELWKFANAFFFDLTLIMVVLVLLGVLFAPLLVKVIAFGFNQGESDLTIMLTRIMFPYIFLISLAALVMAVLNSFHKFFVPAFTPVLFNLSIIVLAVLFAGKAEEPALVFAAGVIVGGILQLAFQIPFAWRRGMRFKPMVSFTHPAVRKVAKLMVPGIFGVGIYQINIAISRTIASFLEEGSISSLYYSSRIQELTLGLFTIALSVALLPTLSDLSAKDDIAGMKRTVMFSLKMIAFVTFPSMIGLLVLNRPVIQVLFQRGVFDAQSTGMTASCLFFFAMGLPFISGVKVLAPAFYSLKDTKTPVIVAFFIMFIYISAAVILMRPLRVAGIALALSISSVFNCGILFILLERKIGGLQKRSLLVSSLKSLIFALIMGGGIWYFFKRFAFDQMSSLDQIVMLFATILLGIVIYVGLSLVFNPEDLKSFKGMFSRGETLKGKKQL